jgi:hypothetical protein
MYLVSIMIGLNVWIICGGFYEFLKLDGILGYLCFIILLSILMMMSLTSFFLNGSKGDPLTVKQPLNSLKLINIDYKFYFIVNIFFEDLFNLFIECRKIHEQLFVGVKLRIHN